MATKREPVAPEPTQDQVRSVILLDEVLGLPTLRLSRAEHQNANIALQILAQAAGVTDEQIRAEREALVPNGSG